MSNFLRNIAGSLGTAASIWLWSARTIFTAPCSAARDGQHGVERMVRGARQLRRGRRPRARLHDNVLYLQARTLAPTMYSSPSRFDARRAADRVAGAPPFKA